MATWIMDETGMPGRNMRPRSKSINADNNKRNNNNEDIISRKAVGESYVSNSVLGVCA
jgi:hypothetical protein